MPQTRLLVYTRENCALCEEFVAELAGVLPAFELRDVDGDPFARRRYGLKVPVLTCDGSVVCHGRVDRDAVSRLASNFTRD